MTTMEERFEGICDAIECPVIGDRNSIDGCGWKCSARSSVENIIRTECARAAKEAVVEYDKELELERAVRYLYKNGFEFNEELAWDTKRLEALSKYGITEK